MNPENVSTLDGILDGVKLIEILREKARELSSRNTPNLYQYNFSAT
jgi:hypothetical protein